MEDKSLLGFRLNVLFIHTPLGVENKDGYQINCLNTNNWSYTTNAWDYWTLNVVYIALDISNAPLLLDGSPVRAEQSGSS